MFKPYLTIVLCLLTKTLSVSTMFFRVNGVAFKVEKNKEIASSKVSSMAKSKVECAILFSLGGIYWSAGYNKESMSCILSDVCPSGTENLTNSTTLIRITECGHCGYIYSTKANSCLKLVSTSGITWTGARTVCLNEGADLVSITTLEKMNVILNLINDLPSSVWIGLRSRRWMTGASFRNVFNIFVQLNNYDIGHPRDRDSSCGALQPTKLLDNSCNIGKWNYFVCEMVHQV